MNSGDLLNWRRRWSKRIIKIMLLGDRSWPHLEVLQPQPLRRVIMTMRPYRRVFILHAAGFPQKSIMFPAVLTIRFSEEERNGSAFDRNKGPSSGWDSSWCRCCTGWWIHTNLTTLCTYWSKNHILLGQPILLRIGIFTPLLGFLNYRSSSCFSFSGFLSKQHFTVFLVNVHC